MPEPATAATAWVHRRDKLVVSTVEVQRAELHRTTFRRGRGTLRGQFCSRPAVGAKSPPTAGDAERGGCRCRPFFVLAGRGQQTAVPTTSSHAEDAQAALLMEVGPSVRVGVHNVGSHRGQPTTGKSVCNAGRAADEVNHANMHGCHSVAARIKIGLHAAAPCSVCRWCGLAHPAGLVNQASLVLSGNSGFLKGRQSLPLCSPPSNCP